MLYTDYDWPSYGGLIPFAHQKETVKFLLANKRAFVLNDLGTGKTLSVLWALDLLLKAGKIKRALIVCPLSTMGSVWLKEIRRHFPYLMAHIAHGTKTQRIGVIKSPSNIVIINHDGVVSVFDELIRMDPDVIVIDELTAFKTHSAVRTKHMTKLAHNVQAVWGLTGQPTPNSPIEAYSQAKIVNPINESLPKYYTQYRDMTMIKINDFTWIPKEHAPNVVSAILRPAIRYKRSECIDLPPTTYETLEVPLTADQEKAYNEMKKQLYLEHEKGSIVASNAAVALNKLLQISAGTVKTSEGEVVYLNNKTRLNELLDIYLETGQKKLIVFSAFRASVEQITDFFNSQGISAAIIYGGLDNHTRTSRINAFQEGDLNVLVMQPQSSAHGITLTAANTIVWFSLIPSNEYYEQANARIVRPSQTRNTLIIRFATTKAEKHLAKILDTKGKLSNEIISLFEHHEL